MVELLIRSNVITLLIHTDSLLTASVLANSTLLDDEGRGHISPGYPWLGFAVHGQTNGQRNIEVTKSGNDLIVVCPSERPGSWAIYSMIISEDLP